MKFYCFIMNNYVGTLEFLDDDIKMNWEPDEKLSTHSKNYKKYIPLSNKHEIECFIGERVCDRRRPGVSPFLSHIGCNLNSSDLEIFIKNHGVSINDCFWINDVKDNSLWQEIRQVFNI